MKFAFKRAVSRRAACIGLSAVMCAAFAAGQFTAFASTGSSQRSASADASEIYDLNFESANGKIDLSQIKIDNLSKDVIKNDGITSDVYSLTRTVIVTLEGAPLSERSYDGKSAQIEIAGEQQAFLTELDNAGIPYEFRSSYASIANAVAIDVKLSYLSQIKHLKGVNTVSVGSTYARPKVIKETDGAQTNASNIYGTGIYNSSEWVKAGYDGSGMTVAVLDTGLDYTHPAFTKDPDETNNAISFTYNYVKDKLENTVAADATDPVPFQSVKNVGADVDDVYISKKVPFAFDYADRDTNVFPSYSQHGTHVAGIVAGKADSYTDKDGKVPMKEVENEAGETELVPVEFRGVAPEAQLVICKVFTDNLEDDSIGGAEAVDILDALEDCYNLNVDVINMSLGTSGGFSSRALCPTDMKEDDEEGYLMKRVYERVRNKGISLIVAASNDYSAGYGSAFGTNLTSNPDSGTVGSPSTFTGALSVASVNGQLAPYLLANAYNTDKESIGEGTAVYFEESRNEDSDAYDFVGEMLGDEEEGTFRYVVIPGTGETTNYTPRIKRLLEPKFAGEKVIAVIKRGKSQFKDKISLAMSNGAAGVIVYNNVSGIIRMSLGDMRKRVPSVSVTMDAGLALVNGAVGSEGYITLNKTKYLAGPFMNDYSSWGATPDLKLKPDVTSHGGEITSAVAGGYYDEMSGTSMACPNLAGFEAIFKGYLKNKPELWKNNELTDEENALALTKLTNNIVMSTATTVYDQNKLPYSPRKQGAGLATLANVFGTSAYLYTKEEDGMCEDGRPKAELGQDPGKNGVYKIKFYVKNFGGSELTFKTNSIFMTETVGEDNMSVAEKAHLLNDNTQWKVQGSSVTRDGGEFKVAAGAEVSVEVTLTLTAEEKKYLNENFANGMFVEGFIQLLGKDGQCDLNLPFMGFYGDWKDAPMMDLTCFDVAKDAKNTAMKDEDRAQPRVWATQPYAYYSGEQYTIPLGSFLYIQDEAKEHTAEYVYVEEDHIAVSRDFHEYNGEYDPSNYITTTGIKALYAGLLRGAEVVTYTLTNVDTGEVIQDERGNDVRVIYRANKSFAGGGNSMPSQVLLELKPDELGLAANGKYRLDFKFYFDYNDYKAYTEGDEHAFENENGETYGVYKDNTFSMNFYVDYEAPVLVDSRLRFLNLKDESGKDYQKVYLDLDMFDNHYPQAVILCYAETEDVTADSIAQIKLATDYVIPVLNPLKNTINTVSVDITEYYEQYRGKLWVEIDDYALNHNTYKIDLNYTKTTAVAPGDFTLTYNGAAVGDNQTITVEKNSVFKFGIQSKDDSRTGWDLSSFDWSTGRESVAKVKNGEVFAVAEGRTMLTVTGGVDENGKTVAKVVTIEVKGEKPLSETVNVVKASFGAVVNSSDALNKAEGFIKVNSGQKLTLVPEPDPWYFPTDGLEWIWTSSDENLAVVDEHGNVEAVYEGEYTENVTITARAEDSVFGEITAEVVLSIQPPFTTNNTTLTKYRGKGGELMESVTIGGETFEDVRVLQFPSDMTITQISERAFEDCENVEIIIIPKSVATIDKRAFEDCVNLKAVCFVQLEPQTIPDSSLTLIHSEAFIGCKNLKVIDLTNCKLITVATSAFADCSELKEVVNMRAIGTAYDGAFRNCTSLTSADISRLYISGSSVFAGCTSLSQVITGKNTAIGRYMFSGCVGLRTVGLNCASIGAGAFSGCSNLETVTYSYDGEEVRSIGARAFENCSSLSHFTVSGKAVASIGDYAFRNCSALEAFLGSEDYPVLGEAVFEGVPAMNGGAEIREGVLTLAPAKVDAAFAAKLANGDITKIAANAFSASRLAADVTELDLRNITEIGAGAFRGLTGLERVTLNAELTEIPAYAFYRCYDLKEINIPAKVKTIGDYAFGECQSLATTNINGLAALESIGVRSFYLTAVKSLNLPDSLKTIGNEAFARCGELTEVTINSVEEMGSRVFALCPALTTAAFGANAQSTGEYTFSTVEYGYVTGADGTLAIGVTDYCDSALTNVEFGDRIKKIGEGLFAAVQISVNGYARCDKLEQIDLNKVETIGAYAFAGCNALASVTGLENVRTVESYAFEDCTALTSVNLSGAREIHACVFQNASALASVTLGSGLDGIGDYAFFGTAITGIQIPASCTYVGKAAFAWNDKITEIKVAAENEKYFDEGGVLYRNIDKANGVYELCAYPAGRVVTAAAGRQSEYKVLEGTVSLMDYAFAYVPLASIHTVILPHSLNVVGHGAFFDSGINTYQFESIEAPALLQGVMDKLLASDQPSRNSFFYINFGGRGYLIDHIKKHPTDATSSARTLYIAYPTNGTGYDNYIYKGFFGNNVTLLGELEEDDTRELKSIIDGLEYSAATVKNWNKVNVSEETVKNFAETVKRAHIIYDSLRTETQKNFVSEEQLNKLFGVENALKAVKPLFNLQPAVSTAVLDASSTHRTVYRTGSRFSLSGVKILVTFDDRTTEVINASGNFKLAQRHDRALADYDTFVTLEGVGAYEGKSVDVAISVSENAPVEESGEGNGISAGVIAAIVICSAAVVAAAVVATVIVLKKRKAVSVVEEPAKDNDQEENSGEEKTDD